MTAQKIPRGGNVSGAAPREAPVATTGRKDLLQKNPFNVWSPKRKRTNSRWPSMGINYPANRPDPDDPGGLGAEESGAERTGPTQDFLFATRKGGRRAEVGRYYDSANVPVTPCFRLEMSRGRSVARIACTALLQMNSVGAIMSFA